MCPRFCRRPEPGPGALDLIIGLADGLLGAAEGVLAVLVGGPAQLPAAVLGHLDHLVGLLFGLGGELVLGQHLPGLLLGLLADELPLPLGGGDVVRPGGQELLGLPQLHGELGLDLIQQVQGLVPLDDALVAAQGHALRLVDHGKEHIHQFFYAGRHQTSLLLSFIFFFTSSMISRGMKSDNSTP